jgi:hypothetical protein
MLRRWVFTTAGLSRGPQAVRIDLEKEIKLERGEEGEVRGKGML